MLVKIGLGDTPVPPLPKPRVGLTIMKKKQEESLSPTEFTRLANNFYIQNGINVDYQRIVIDSQLVNYILTHKDDLSQKFKVALCFICLNPPYWQYMNDAIAGSKQFFLPGHDTDIFLWSDIPTTEEGVLKKANELKAKDQTWDEKPFIEEVWRLSQQVQEQTTLTETASIDWPMGTLMRYNLMLQQEEKLKEYDYVFYCDIDMRFVNVVGDEILGDGLTAAQHPMYALRKEYIPPYEPNKESAAFIPRPGKIVPEGDKKRFLPLYYAGGFQGGKADLWVKAMRAMKKTIDTDFNNDYIAIWNDESHWNKYLSENEPSVVLTPSYIYPDSLIEEYYKKIWGVDYPPRLVTLTKPFTTSTDGGQAVQQMLGSM